MPNQRPVSFSPLLLLRLTGFLTKGRKARRLERSSTATYPKRVRMLPANIDFETRSTIDLKATGVYPYAAHPSTDVWVLAVAYGDEEPEIWCPQAPELFPTHKHVADRLACHILDGGELHAWNASFERQIWNGIMTPRYKFPKPEMDQFFCSMVDAAAYGLPLQLEQASHVLETEFQKDMEGNRLMKQMMKPREIGEELLVWEDPYAYALGAEAHKAKYGTRTIKKDVKYPREETKIFRLAQYCILDVKTERAVSKLIKPLSPSERALYLLDQKINDRGVYLDVPLAKSMITVAEIATAKADAEMQEATDGRVKAVTQVIELTSWIAEQGVPCTSVAKPAVASLLETKLPPQVRQALTIRQESGKSSVAKVETMLDYAVLDGFMRGMLSFHGAGTGRWAGRGPQPQNFPKGTIPGIEYLLGLILRCDIRALNLVDSPMEILASALRSLMRARLGYALYVADFNAIEARVLGWLAGQDELTESFRAYDLAKASGAKIRDGYEKMAASIYKVPLDAVTKEQRFLGKVAILQLGYQAGAKGFQTSAENWGATVQLYSIDDVNAIRARHALEAERNEGKVSPFMAKLRAEAVAYPAAPGVGAYGIVQTYRKDNDRICAFWKTLERLVVTAVREGDASEGNIAYYVEGQWLFCQLPSGRTLKYARPTIEQQKAPWGEMLDRVRVEVFNSKFHKWEGQYLYGGLLAENITQAVARDLMAEAMVRVENAGYNVILTVHDEVVSEAPANIGSVQEFESLMCQIPDWAAGCPVAAEAWTGLRYKK